MTKDQAVAQAKYWAEQIRSQKESDWVDSVAEMLLMIVETAAFNERRRIQFAVKDLFNIPRAFPVGPPIR